jgi:hypothetical protein
MGTWTNSDGLRIKIGATEANVTQGGEYNVTGQVHEVQVRFNLTSLGTATALLEPGIIIPKGARIDSVEVVAETAATSGGAAALNIGLVRLDNTTAIDEDGLVAALALSTINVAGEKNVLTAGTTGAGALVGTTLANAGKFVADYDTAAYTAGVVLATVKFYVPIPTATNVGL